MSRPIVIAHHLIFTVYGWWLPNDPRGSRSREMRSLALEDLGELHFERKRVQPSRRELRAFYREAGKRLKHSLLEFDDREIEIVARSLQTSSSLNDTRVTRARSCRIMFISSSANTNTPRRR